MFVFKYMRYHEITYARRTEKKKQNFKYIHIFRSRPRHIQMFHKELFKTVGAFALKRFYLYIDINKILIALKVENF